LDLGFETGDEFAVGVDQRPPGFDLRHRAVRNCGQPTFCFRGLTLREQSEEWRDVTPSPLLCSFRGPAARGRGFCSPQMRASVDWIFCSKRVMSSRLALSSACPASISAAGLSGMARQTTIYFRGQPEQKPQLNGYCAYGLMNWPK